MNAVTNLPELATTELETLPIPKLRLGIQKLKTFASPEGGGFNCELLFDGKVIAKAHDAGNGGCINYWAVEKKAAELREAEAYAKALPMSPSPLGEDYGPMQRSLDIVIFEIFEWQQTIAWIKRNSKNNLVYQKVPAEKSVYFLSREWWKTPRQGLTDEVLRGHVLKQVKVPEGMKIVFGDEIMNLMK